MSANVETMFSVRETPWHGLGTIVQEALNSKEALEMAGLNWEVKSRPIYLSNGNKIPEWFANVRTSDESVLGVVTGKYSILQNKDAFDFTDNLIGGDVKYETAGSLCGGKRVWLLAKLPSTEIAGDKVDPYLCFTNSHDGKSSVRACITPVRVVCNNTLNLALAQSSRQFSIRHFKNVADKVKEAREILELNDIYLYNLANAADNYCNVSVSEEYFNKLLEKLYPHKEDESEATKKHVEKAREDMQIAYLSPDIAKFMGTAWGVINAASDVAGHATPSRLSQNYNENRWGKIMDGHPLLDKVVSEMNSLMVHA